MDSQMYSHMLFAYEERITNMSDEERRIYLRKDFVDIEHSHHSSYADYLDFIEEWEYDFTKIQREYEQDFILRILVAHKVKIECGNHTHTFTACDGDPFPDKLIIDVHDPIKRDTCWYNTFTKSKNDLTKNNVGKFARLTVSLNDYYNRLIKIRTLEKTGIPERIDYEAYKAIFVDGKKPNYPDTPLLKRLEAATEVKKNHTLQKTDKTKTSIRIVLSNNEVAVDHGLHTLLHTMNDWGMLNTINSIRRKVDISASVSQREVLNAMDTCIHCKNSSLKNHSIPLSPLGVYYVQPGGGKTTSFSKEYFIGLDTDWLHSALTIDDLHQVIIQKVPILTNQHQIGHCSPYKLFGSYNEEKSRLDEKGVPYVTKYMIEAAKISLSYDAYIYNTHSYLNRNLLTFFYLRYFQNIVIDKLMKSNFTHKLKFNHLTREIEHTKLDKTYAAHKPKKKFRKGMRDKTR